MTTRQSRQDIWHKIVLFSCCGNNCVEEALANDRVACRHRGSRPEQRHVMRAHRYGGVYVLRPGPGEPIVGEMGLGTQGDRTILIILLPGSRTGSTAASAAGLAPGTRAPALRCRAWQSAHCAGVDIQPGPRARIWAIRLSCGVLVEAAEKALCDRISSLVRIVRSPC